MIGAALVGALLAAATTPALGVADRCAIVRAVLDSKATMPAPNMQTVEVSFPDLPGLRNRTSVDGRPVVKVDWRLRREYRPMFPSASSSSGTICGNTVFTLIEEQAESDRGVRELVVLVTITPASDDRLHFAFEEKVAVNRQHKFDPGVGGVVVPSTKYSGVVKKSRDGAWTATVTKARFTE